MDQEQGKNQRSCDWIELMKFERGKEKWNEFKTFIISRKVPYEGICKSFGIKNWHSLY